MKIYEIQTLYKSVGTASYLRTIETPSDIAMYMKGAFDAHLNQEQFWCILLSSGNKPLGRIMCTLGLVNQCQVHPREAFRFAVREGAAAVVFCHNHPSGNHTPSNEDLAVTKRLLEAGRILDIPVLDHVILTDDGISSIRSRNPEYFKV